MVTVDELRSALLASWGADTCYPDWSAEWTADNPSRDQCGMTALVVQDVLGGDLLLGEVHVEGSKIGHHYWNRLPVGHVVDLTVDQFLPEEVVVGGEVVVRPPEGPRRHVEQYELLRSRVLRSLESSG
jgi:hypothetical protein